MKAVLPVNFHETSDGFFFFNIKEFHLNIIFPQLHLKTQMQ